MEENASKQIIFGEGVQEKLGSSGVSILPDGTISFKGEIATPKAIIPELDLKNLDALVVGSGKTDGEFELSYLTWPLESVFSLEVAKNARGDDTLHFYVKESPKEINIC